MNLKLAKSKVHFIGVGGIGMSGLAELLHNMGAQVSGSDLGANANTYRLQEMGVEIFKGHDAANIGEAEVVVYSSAITPKNCEFSQAKETRIPLIPRAEALSEIMRLKRGIVVAGTHGKTTTTSIISSIFLQAKKDPTIAVGGRLESIGSNAKLGKGEWMIAESDESDGSFLMLYPEISVITNIDNDHVDYYGDFLSLKKAFYKFACNIPFYGSLVCCGDDPMIRDLMAPFSKKIIYYGLNANNDYQLKQLEPFENCEYEVYCEEEKYCSLKIPLPGRHNALNSLAALIASTEAGIDLETATQGIENFNGVGRRFEYKDEVDGVIFYDDYGHHPTEIKAVFNSFRDRYPGRRLVVFFEPHRYTRMKDCWEEFIKELKEPDLVFVTRIYEASETPIPGVTAEAIVASVPKAQLLDMNTKWEGEKLNPYFQQIQDEIQSNDICVTLGAGKINVIGEKLIEYLKDHA